ncbi:MAG: shikimate kinase [Gordonia sp. (in: high G+C Gram-positive bacteria)]
MGAGKSTVGRELAALAGVEFIDTDVEIERRAGRRIPEIFAADGEAGFRALEAETVADVLSTHRGVVALGGGAVMTPAVREALSGHPVVYLKISADAGFARVAGSDRPLLASDDPAAVYAGLLALRGPVYTDAARLVVDAHRAPAEVARDIESQLRSAS